MIKAILLLFILASLPVHAHVASTPQRRVFIQHIEFQKFINHWNDDSEENYYYGAEGKAEVMLYTNDGMSELFDLVLKENEFSNVSENNHFKIKGEYSILDFDHTEALDYFLLQEDAQIASFEVKVSIKKIKVIGREKLLKAVQNLNLKFNDEDNREAFNDFLKTLEPDQILHNQELQMTVEDIHNQCLLESGNESNYVLHKEQNEELAIVWGC
ncbi:MAG: hypothetical protein JNM93_12995 [Bacteriovoracaceae bacterium]|nr:hypothetical protein [Bacteriovoracaceae bacterium]